jgi:DUF177 domain-containing protein
MLDVAALGLAPGDVRRVDVPIDIEPLRFGGQTYAVDADGGAVELQATSGGLYLKLHFDAAVSGPCYRCLEDARTAVAVDATEYQERGADPDDDELSTEYLLDEELDVDRWARDALVLALPDKILCRPECAGMCPRCGARLEPGVAHDCAPAETDPRWESLRQLLE